MKSSLFIPVLSLLLVPQCGSAKHFFVPEVGGASHVFFITRIELEEDSLQLGDDLSAFDEHDVCAGTFLRDEENCLRLILWADDPETERDEGFDEGESILFRFWDSSLRCYRSVEAEIVNGEENFIAGRESEVELTIPLPQDDERNPHWWWQMGEESHSILVEHAEINGRPVLSNDEVYVFNPRNYCVGGAKFIDVEGSIRSGLAAWGDSPEDGRMEVYMWPGERYTYFLWDLTHEIGAPAEAEYEAGPDYYERDAFSIVTLSADGIPKPLTEDAVYDFGVVDSINGAQNWTTSLWNNGNGTCTISNIEVAGDVEYFEISHDLDELDVDTFSTITVDFPIGEYEPGATYSVELRVSFDEIDTTIVFRTGGTIGVPRFVIDRDTVDMGYACPGEDGYDTPQYTYDTLHVSNPGNATAIINRCTFGDSAFFLPPAFPVSCLIQPGRALEVPIVFHPWRLDIADSLYGAWMTFSTNTADSESVLRVWLHGRSVWGIEVNPDIPIEPNTFSLSAFPNPFNSSVTISFTTLGFGEAELRIYDISGREVVDLTEQSKIQNLKSKIGKVVWDATSVGAGVYFVRLENNGVRTTRKLLLIR